jgi:hypothetical protein
MNNFFLEASYKGLLSTEAGDSIKADGLKILKMLSKKYLIIL